MVIGICDDEREFRVQLKKELNEQRLLQDSDRLLEFSSAFELLEAGEKLDLLFLDIEMPKLSGMTLMREYPQVFQHTKVVFMTSYDYMQEGYEVGIYRYLLKPIQSDKLRELFESIEKQNVLRQKVSVKSKGVDIEVALEDVLYIEAQNNKTEIVTKNGRYENYNTMKIMKDMLPQEYFYASHKSFIVNWYHVCKITDGDRRIIMSNGDMVEIGIRKRKECMEKYMNYKLRA